MADIGEPQRIIEVEPLSVPEKETERPIEPDRGPDVPEPERKEEPVPDKEKVPA